MLPALNIVVYTDYPQLFHENPLSPKGGLSDFEAFVKDKTKQFVQVSFKFVSRHTDPVTGNEVNGAQKLTEEILSDAHELWVFGFRKSKDSDEPHNELDTDEIALLEGLIHGDRKVGIFVTGDHSESETDESCTASDHQTYSSRGRALGEHIPIAGLLRDWVGPPTNCNDDGSIEDRDNFNTQEGSDPSTLDIEGKQYDSLPQTIILKLKDSQPHRLFTYVDAGGELRQITKLPDHAHEGRVFGIEDLAGVWSTDLPIPEVVAQGRDKRFPDEDRVSNLVVAFDGDAASLSRIVADSSFHHYLNSNLIHIESRNPASGLPEPDSDLDQMAHFYGNLALWLAPKPVRDQIKFDILLSLANHHDVHEVSNHNDLKRGRVGLEILNAIIGPGRMEWLFGASPFEKRDPIDEAFSFLFLRDQTTTPFHRVFKPEWPLGIVLRVCRQYLKTKNRVAGVTAHTSHDQLKQLLLGSFSLTMEIARREFSNQGSISDQEFGDLMAIYEESKRRNDNGT